MTTEARNQNIITEARAKVSAGPQRVGDRCPFIVYSQELPGSVKYVVPFLPEGTQVGDIVAVDLGRGWPGAGVVLAPFYE